MPRGDGTGPLGEGPLTGRGEGFCVLANSEKDPCQIRGFAGLHGVPVGEINGNYENTGKEVINMPFGDGTGPTGSGPMTGRAAGFCGGYPVPGYMNPVAGRVGFYGSAGPVFRPYNAVYGVPYGGRVNSWLRRGFGFGRGLGRGRGWGRGRFVGRFGLRW